MLCVMCCVLYAVCYMLYAVCHVLCAMCFPLLHVCDRTVEVLKILEDTVSTVFLDARDLIAEQCKGFNILKLQNSQ